jgi:hypothetical protein
MKLTVEELLKMLQGANSNDYVCINLEGVAAYDGKYETIDRVTASIQLQKGCPSYEGELSAKVGQSVSCSIGIQTTEQLAEEKLVALSQFKTIKEIFDEYICFDFPTGCDSENYFSIDMFYCVMSEDEATLDKSPYDKGLINNWLFEGSLEFFYGSASHNFKAFHPKYGKVWGHNSTIFANNKKAYEQFIQDMSLPIKGK